MQGKVTWLHLSDLHLCPPLSGWNATKVTDDLIRDLQEVSKEYSLVPDLIFFTGDAAYGELRSRTGKGRSLEEQFGRFKEFIEQVRKAIPGHEVPLERVFLVPGNHDTDRDVALPYKSKVHDLTVNRVNEIQRDAEEPNSNGDLWRDLVSRLDQYRNAFSSWGHLCMDDQRCCYAVKVPLGEFSVGVAGLNTAWCSTDKDDQGHLWIGSYQLETLYNKIIGCDLLIALTHHPDHWFTAVQNRGLSEYLTTRFHFRLHGHDHVDWVRILALPNTNHISIAAGAIYLEEGQPKEEELGYNLVTYNPRTGGRVLVRRYNTQGTGGFVPAEIPNTTKRGIWVLPPPSPTVTPLEEMADGLSQKIDDLLRKQPFQTQLIRRLLTSHMSGMESDVLPLLEGGQISAPLHRVESIVSVFYEALEESYIGVDSHVPSDFLEVHPFLLDHLSGPLSGRRSSSQCYGRHVVRILPISLRDLNRDYKKNRSLFKAYLALHRNSGIHLLRVEPSVVKRARVLGTWTTDVGLWLRSCALLFEAKITQKEQLRLELIYVTDRTRFQPWVEYLKELIVEARMVVQSGNQIRDKELDEELKEDLVWNLENLCEPQLAQAWFDFVRPEERWNKGMKDFLLPLLRRYNSPRVFDAAMGVGCESVHLLEAGYEVDSNEIEEDFIVRAEEYAQMHGVKLNLTRYDWRHMKKHLPKGEYHVVLAIGNSLTCLGSKADMIKCLDAFHHILRPDGILVIDERNYRDMLVRRDEMLRKDFRFPGVVVYVGEIKAKPGVVDLLDERVADEDRKTVLEYIEPGQDHPVGQWIVFPYRDGEVEELLTAAHFRVEKRFWDFTERQKEDAEFVTYVAAPIGEED